LAAVLGFPSSGLPACIRGRVKTGKPPVSPSAAVAGLAPHCAIPIHRANYSFPPWAAASNRQPFPRTFGKADTPAQYQSAFRKTALVQARYLGLRSIHQDRRASAPISRRRSSLGQSRLCRLGGPLGFGRTLRVRNRRRRQRWALLATGGGRDLCLRHDARRRVAALYARAS
jgi:hypothetical protein